MDYENQLLLAAFKLFLSNNYEKVTIGMIEKESGITRKTLYRHLGSKDKLFIKVCGKFIFDTQDVEKKIAASPGMSLHDFILTYVAGVNATMVKMLSLSIVNIYKNYFFLIMQASNYYPGFKERIIALNMSEYNCWKKILTSAVKSKEIKSNIDIDAVATQFRCVFLGMSFEHSLTYGLNTDILLSTYMAIYNQIKK